jgi:hypothetical protein
VLRTGKIISRIICAAFAAVLLMASSISTEAAEGKGAGTVFPARYNDYADSLVSTQTTLLNGIWFTVDCYNDRILYNDTLDLGSNLFSWKVMADDLNKPHSICSDGIIYLVVDTDNNRVVTYSRLPSGEFIELQSVPYVGIRPHYCEYDAATGSFYVWSSYTGEMYIFKRNSNGLDIRLTAVKKLDCLYGLYTRSFTIDGNNILLCSQGIGGILVVDKKTFRLVAGYAVCDELGGVVQVVHIGKHYYLTTSSDRYGNRNTAMIARADSLAGFVSPLTYTDVTSELGGLTGSLAPYYISYANGAYIARFNSVGSGFDEHARIFAEDIFGNLIVGGMLP